MYSLLLDINSITDKAIPITVSTDSNCLFITLGKAGNTLEKVRLYVFVLLEKPTEDNKLGISDVLDRNRTSLMV